MVGKKAGNEYGQQKRDPTREESRKSKRSFFCFLKIVVFSSISSQNCSCVFLIFRRRKCQEHLKKYAFELFN